MTLSQHVKELYDQFGESYDLYTNT